VHLLVNVKHSSREFEPKTSIYSGSVAVLSAAHATGIFSHYYYKFFAGNCLSDGNIKLLTTYIYNFYTNFGIRGICLYFIHH